MVWCFSSREPQAPTREQLQACCAKLREENTKLLQQQERLLQLNSQLRSEAEANREQSSRAAQEVRVALEAAQQRFDTLQQESSTVAEELHRWRQQAQAQEEQHAQEVSALTERHQAEMRKQHMMLAAEHQAKVQMLDQRIVRYQREKAKLLDQIQRRDQALYLARQIIDVVDRTGMLGSCDTGLGSLLQDAVADPSTLSPRSGVHDSGVGLRSSRVHQAAGHAPILDELRHSIKQFAAFSAATTASPVTNSPGVPLLSTTEEDVYAEPTPGSSDSEGVLNPLWRLTACPDAGASEEGDAHSGASSRCSTPLAHAGSNATAYAAAAGVVVVTGPGQPLLVEGGSAASSKGREPVLQLYAGTIKERVEGRLGKRAGRYTSSRGSSTGGMPAPMHMHSKHSDVGCPDQVP